MSFQVSDRRVGYKLNKSEKATPGLFAIYMQNSKLKVYLNVQRLGYALSKRFTNVVTRIHIKVILM